jgi:hypothetical protein
MVTKIRPGALCSYGAERPRAQPFIFVRRHPGIRLGPCSCDDCAPLSDSGDHIERDKLHILVAQYVVNVLAIVSHNCFTHWRPFCGLCFTLCLFQYPGLMREFC